MTQTSTAVRSYVETYLKERVPAPFAQKTIHSPELLPTRIPSIDQLLGGGIAHGSLTEITGNSSTGRTGLAFAALATATRKGAACAWVDVQDAFDPESAAAWGIDLQRLLWLRAGKQSVAEVHARPCVLTQSQPSTPFPSTSGGMHPRNEVRNMDRAVSLLFQGVQSTPASSTLRQNGLLRDKTIGTPGAANRVLYERSTGPRCAESQPACRKIEQIATDRLPPRRGDLILNKPPAVVAPPVSRPHTQISKSAEKPWSRLDQALRATDLLLPVGGFAVIVLDMCDIRAEQILRIPMATWYRFRLAAEQTRTALVLLTEVPCAQSCAALSLRCEQAGQDMAAPVSKPGLPGKTLLTGLQYRVHVDRKRGDTSDHCINKKPSGSVSTTWSSYATGAR